VQSDNRFDTPFPFMMDLNLNKERTLKDQDEGNQHGLINKRRNFHYQRNSTENSLIRRKNSDYLLKNPQNRSL
jgi:uncharacterized protein YcgL (UPF0745 family)